MAKGDPYKKGRKRCIFCEEYNVSKEHVFGDWLRELFPRDSKTTHTHGTVIWHEPDQPDESSIARMEKQGHTGSKKVRVVCQTCNTNWLSTKIESSAKPVLIPLITNHSGLLSEAMQRILAVWVAKTAMTAEFINKTNPTIHQHERTHLRKHMEPPPGWFICAAPYVGNEWRDLGLFQHTVRLEVPSVENHRLTEHNIGLTFIGMGHLLLLIRHSTWSRLWPALAAPVPHLSQIWPITGDIDWPPQVTLTDRETEYLTTCLARVLNNPV